MNKSMKPSAVAQRTLTEEEKEERIARIFLQKKASLVEGVIFNMVQGNVVADAKGIVKIANDIADEFMRVIYGQEITIKKASEEKEEEGIKKRKEERERLKGNLKEEVCASDVCAYRGKNVCTIKRNEYCPMFEAKEE